MSRSNLIRWSGLAAILCGLLYPVCSILYFEVIVGSQRILTDTLWFVAFILYVFGLMGIYGSQIEESGFFGFLGFLLLIIHDCILLGENWLPEKGQSVGVASVLGPLSGITGLAGYILLGIGLWKANKLPRWTFVLWPIGLALFGAGVAVEGILGAIGGTILGIGLVGAGVNLWSGTVEPVRKPEAAT
ncbi:MAG: hypothetical protein KAS38_22850 [Anaerolineales bacterium]|nr:hypothetical protein [Anaerolineales bacterium]